MPGHTTKTMKKKSSKRSRTSAKSQTPAVRYLRYDVVNSGSINTETSHFIDLAKDLSAINRRLYRQGRHYHVRRVTVSSANTPNVGPVDNPGTGGVVNQSARVTLSTSPYSWVSQMAWKRGFEVYKDMNVRAQRNLAGDISGTWADFKVYLSTSHRNGTKLTPIDNGNNAVQYGEWVYSQYTSPDGTTSADSFDACLLGDHVGSAGSRVTVGLIKSYGESRATVTSGDPSVPGDLDSDPLLNVFDYGTEIDEVLNRLESDNDTPPYDHADYPGDDGNMPKPLVVQDACMSDGSITFGGFQAMCGLIEIESKSPVANDTFSILVELAPGNYRGIKADVI